jgi:acyl-CoA oxidase
MSQLPPSINSYSPGVQSLLPLFYVAWADRVLSPSEVRLLRSKIKDLKFLSKEDKILLQRWSDPRALPDRQLFQHWKIVLRNAAEQLDPEKKQTFADLGFEMAKRTATEGENKVLWAESDTRKALQDLEDAIGGVSTATYHTIFPKSEKQLRAEQEPVNFDPKIIQELLDSDSPEIKRKMRVLLSDPLFRYKTLRVKEDYRNQVLEWTKMLANQGMGALAYPEEYGGVDDMRPYSAVFEMLGYHDLSLAIKFGVQFGLWGGAIQRLGTKKHHDAYLKGTGTAEILGCFAMTETGHGSNVRGLETTGTYDADKGELVVHSPCEGAGKEYIGNAMHSRYAAVFCQLIVNNESHGVHAIVVPLRDKNNRLLPGIRVEDNGYKVGLNGVDNGRIWFDNVRVPRENLLNKYGDIDAEGNYSSPIDNPSKRFFTMLGTLVGGRVCVPRAGLSAAKSGLAIAIKYASKRRQFAGNTSGSETIILDYQSHQRRLMPLLAKAYAVDFGLKFLTDKFVAADEDEMREVETLAAGFKSYATWFTTHTLQQCREACGGKGYLAENRLADLKADTDIFTTFEGDNTVLMQLVAKGVLSAFKQELNDDGMVGVLRMLGSRVAVNLNKLNPVYGRRSDREHLLDGDFHEEALQFREEQILYSVAQRMRRKIKGGMSSFEAYNQCQTHLIALAEAYIERLTVENFRKKINTVEDANAKAVLTDVCNLYALHTIEKHSGWFMEYDYLESLKSKAIRSTVDALCLKVRGNAVGLVDAFGIPDELLAAPIVV